MAPIPWLPESIYSLTRAPGLSAAQDLEAVAALALAPTTGAGLWTHWVAWDKAAASLCSHRQSSTRAKARQARSRLQAWCRALSPHTLVRLFAMHHFSKELALHPSAPPPLVHMDGLMCMCLARVLGGIRPWGGGGGSSSQSLLRSHLLCCALLHGAPFLFWICMFSSSHPATAHQS